MRRPEMILFDYGHTLAYEVGYDTVHGIRAVLEHATRNENNLTAAEVAAMSDDLFAMFRVRSNLSIEVHNHMINRLLYEYLQIDIALDPYELERIFWDAFAPGENMPNIELLLEYLHQSGIRTAVISNISFSGQTLSDRLNRMLPENHFEFIIASSEYAVRKPDRLIFELALRKARLPAEQVWYCGDRAEPDVEGAAGAGIFPVWFQHHRPAPGMEDAQSRVPACWHLHIRDWLELIDILEGCE